VRFGPAGNVWEAASAVGFSCFGERVQVDGNRNWLKDRHRCMRVAVGRLPMMLWKHQNIWTRKRRPKPPPLAAANFMDLETIKRKNEKTPPLEIFS
jgi:hypothetical protein